jgi:hypothetical protein
LSLESSWNDCARLAFLCGEAISRGCAAIEASEYHQEDTMRKLLLVNIAVAALATGALTSGSAQATTLGAAAGLRSAVDGAGPIEQVQYWRWRHHHRHYGYYGFRSYAFYPRRHHRSYYYRSW